MRRRGTRAAECKLIILFLISSFCNRQRQAGRKTGGRKGERAFLSLNASEVGRRRGMKNNSVPRKNETSMQRPPRACSACRACRATRHRRDGTREERHTAEVSSAEGHRGIESHYREAGREIRQQLAGTRWASPPPVCRYSSTISRSFV